MESRADTLAKNTLATKLGLWAANLRDNLSIINSCKDITELPKINGSALCIAAGESTELHLDEIPKFRGSILSCERNLVQLLKKGIIPEYVVSIDGNEIMTQFIDHPLVDEYADRMTGVFATTVSPKFVDRWHGKKIFFNAWLDNIDDTKSVSLVFQEITRKATMHTGGNCGTTLWFLAYYLKASTIVLLGLDFAYPASIQDLSQTQIWAGIKHLPKEQILEYYRRETNPFGNEIITDYVWEAFKDAWLSWVREMKDSETIQCSDYTILHEPPLKIRQFTEILT